VEGASVLLDGSEVEKTDGNGQAYIADLRSGSYTISLQKSGYVTAEQTVELGGSLTTTVSFELQPEPSAQEPGGLFVESSPGNAAVLIDGQSAGNTDSQGNAYLSGIAPGEYRVTLQKDGYQPASRTITFDGSGLDRSVQVQLQPVPAASEPDQRSGDEAGTSSNRSASDVAASPNASTNPGSNPVGSSREENEANAPAGGTSGSTAATLQIDTNVGGADVYVDGAYRGRTTSQGSANISMQPGRYRVAVTKDGFRGQERVTQLQSGNTRMLRFILDPAASGARAAKPSSEGVDLPLMLALLLVGAIGVVAVVLVVLVRQDSGSQGGSQGTSEVTGTFDRYRLQRMLGRGGMATVYLAEDSLEDRQVALKVLDLSHLNDQDLVRKFVGEGEALKRINQSHPEAPVVKAYRVGYEQGVTQGRPFVALEYLEGSNLLTYMKENGTLEIAGAVSIVQQVCEGLQAAHHNQIWHRDITPDNVIVMQERPRFAAKLIDFGVAKHEYTSQGTMDGSIMGKPPYMSPEQCRNEPVDGRSDVYSVGILLYTMLTGEPPFTDDNPLQVMQMHEQSTVPDLPAHVPGDVRTLFRKMVRKKPADRPSASDVVSTIATIKVRALSSR